MTSLPRDGKACRKRLCLVRSRIVSPQHLVGRARLKEGFDQSTQCVLWWGMGMNAATVAAPDKQVVQSFARGLSVLAALNLADGATIAALSARTGLNRAIVFRLLETLVRNGYVAKRRSDPKYWLTGSVRNLADGYGDEDWIDAIARPAVSALGKTTAWPVSLSTLSGGEMLVRATSDYESPMVLRRFPRGFRFILVGSAAGNAYLAFAAPAVRDAALAAAARSRTAGEMPPRGIDNLLSDVRQKGYALSPRQNNSINAIAVPVLSGKHSLAALSLRYFAGAMSNRTAVMRFLGPLQTCASAIGDQV